jgi:predicted nucleic acid-binding protein
LSDTQIDDIIDFICASSHHHEIFYLWRPTLRDANDDFVLELAVSSQSQIITWNERDFKKAESFGIQVMNPRNFLVSLGIL